MGFEVKIVEVGPRDGLQNERHPLPVALKTRLVDDLAASGLREIEAVSFVSERAVPQMASSAEVMAGIERGAGVRHRALVPNARGMAAALEAKVDEIAVFASASQTFSHHNINCDIDESFARFAPVIEMARASGIPVRGYLSCAFGCPYEGAVSDDMVVATTARLLEAGCYEVAVSDTIGIGGAGDVRRLLASLLADVEREKIALHFHDTRGQALANVLAGLDAGIRCFDSSVGGLGGCPYAPGATGNLATEELVYLLESLGVATGVDLTLLATAGLRISSALGKPAGSRIAQALLASGALDANAIRGVEASSPSGNTVGLPEKQKTGVQS
ncbi:MAG: hydroxymethylglutaryl-CoA lyase [Rhizobiales bacterium]|nr:hydroxymethylglutaryl-CoA lyase [Hyphomicrobiales bacterium]